MVLPELSIIFQVQMEMEVLEEEDTAGLALLVHQAFMELQLQFALFLKKLGSC